MTDDPAVSDAALSDAALPDAALRDEALRDEAERCLRALAGPGAVLREDQWTAVRALVTERRRALVVQRTGWGKSAVYFPATALLRARMPARIAASTWLRMSASSGDTITVGPAPRARSIAVALK